MNASQVEKYLRIIDGMVMDEQKIVTYKLLNRTFDQHVNIGKQLLYIYLSKQQKDTASTVSATHLLAGLSKDGKFLVSIVTDDQLDEARQKYDKITSEHVYSVQKGNSSGLEKNSQMVYAADSVLEPPESYPIKYQKILVGKSGEPRNGMCQVEGVKTEAKSDEKIKENKAVKLSHRKDQKPGTEKPGVLFKLLSNKAQSEKLDKPEKSCINNTEEIATNVPETDLREMRITDIPEGEQSQERPSNLVKEKKKRKRILSASEDTQRRHGEKRDALLCADPEVCGTAGTLKMNDDDAFLMRKARKVVTRTYMEDDGFLETRREVVYETESVEESPKEMEKEAEVDGDEAGAGSSVRKEEPAWKKMKNNPKKQSTLFSFFKKN